MKLNYSMDVSSKKISIVEEKRDVSPLLRDSNNNISNNSSNVGGIFNDNNSSNNINISSNNIEPELVGIPDFIRNIMPDQPTINIMTLGDVSHGKSTLMYAYSGEKTGRHSQSIKNNMTIRLGYTQIKIYKCLICPKPVCYFNEKSYININKIKCPTCNTGKDNIVLLRHLSFIDVPGHCELMGTMINAISAADAALLVSDTSKTFPGYQTKHHFDTANILGLFNNNNLIIAQNKIDIVSKQKACKNIDEIRAFLNKYNDNNLYNTPIIPICAQSKINIDILSMYIINNFPKYSLKLNKCNDHLLLNVIRSFDCNKALTINNMNDIDKLNGGVIGCVILSGSLQFDDEIELRPGLIKLKNSSLLKKNVNINKMSSNEKFKYYTKEHWKVYPLKTFVKSIQCGKQKLKVIYPGGNVGIQLNIDPSLTKADRMVGQIGVSINNNNNNKYKIFNNFIMSYVFIGEQKRFNNFENIRLNIGSNKINNCVILKYCLIDNNNNDNDKEMGVYVYLSKPICARIGDKVAITRYIKKTWIMSGAGIIRKIREIKPIHNFKHF